MIELIDYVEGFIDTRFIFRNVKKKDKKNILKFLKNKKDIFFIVLMEEFILKFGKKYHMDYYSTFKGDPGLAYIYKINN